jgi:Ca2+-binding RTX toxin-like protein
MKPHIASGERQGKPRESSMAVKQGGAGVDILVSGDDGDFLVGFGGNDILKGFGGNDVLHGGAGIDWMGGGDGDDSYHVDNVNDDVVESANAGYDRVYASTSYSIFNQDNVEELRLTDAAGVSGAEGNDGDNMLVGNAFANSLTGHGGDDWLIGEDGSDTLIGNEGEDELLGGGNADVLIGGIGRDVLNGGGGADHFVFYYGDLANNEGGADEIEDFNAAAGDVIDLSAIDADVYANFNQAFTFIGMAAFSGTPGEINYYHSGGNTYIQLQTGNVVDVEGVIRLDGIHNPDASWFVL